MRRAKIICTIGPASESEAMLKELIHAGMNVARVNFSHGERAWHNDLIDRIRRVSKDLQKPLAIIQDLQGPKIRIGTFINGSVKLEENQLFKITTREIMGTAEIASTSYKKLPADLKKGNQIFLNDGLIPLEVISTSTDEITCKVLKGGVVSDHKGINLPNIKLNLPSITEKDIDDLQFGISKEVDFIAISFVRTGKDLKNVREIIRKSGKNIPLIAKIEKPEAVDHLDEILDNAEGVMIARGDLGIEVSAENVPILQKSIIEKANQKNKVVITATEMLESMINSPRPTRAEVSDVANAIFDGSDCLMLSAETASGKYPLDAVKMMDKIIKVSEENYRHKPIDSRRVNNVLSFTDAVCFGAFHAAKEIKAKAIVCFTQSGSTAIFISKYRPRMPIIAFTPNQNIIQRMSLYWGVLPEEMQLIENTDELIRELDIKLEEKNIAKKGDSIVIITGAPVGKMGSTNMMKLHKIGE